MSATMDPDFSVVIAAKDEADNLGPVLAEIEAEMAGSGPFEIIVVDDGSTDQTAERVLERQAAFPAIRLVRHAYGRGKSAALASGIAAARGRWIVTMDADGQDDPKEALKLLETLRGAPGVSPMVAGTRRRRRDGRWRLIATRLANGIRQGLLQDDCPDSGCGLKAFERELFLKFPVFEGLHRFLPALAKAQGHPVVNVPIEQRPRMSGESRYSNLGRAAVGLFDLFGVAWLIARTRPERQREPAPIAAVPNKRVGLFAYIVLALYALLMFAPGQSALPPMDRDESRYAQATAQMLETRDFIDIRYQDQERHLQPAGIYWLQAASVAIFSDVADRAIWANRLPSLVSAILAVLMTAWIGAMAFGRGAGILAAIGMASCLLLGVEARMAKIDATLLATTLAAQGVLLRAYLNRGERLERGLVLLFWGALGLGLMLKGPIILLMVGGAALGTSLWDRSIGWLKVLRPAYVLLTLAIVLPWLAAITIRTDGAFLSEALGHSMLNKVGTAQQAHGAPPGYHLLMLPLMFWPMALFAVPAGLFAWANRRLPAVRFMLCWILPTWVVFEAVATKLPHYMLPAYPAIACLAGAALLSPRLWPARRWARLALAGLIGLIVLVGAAVALAPAIVGLQYGSTMPVGSVLISLVVLGLWALASRTAFKGQAGRSTALVAAFAGLALLPLTFGDVLPSLQRIWLSRAIDVRFDAVKPCPGSVLASAPYAEPSMVYLTATATRLVNGEQAAAHVLADPACAVALVGGGEEAKFMAALGNAGRTPEALSKVSGLNYSNGRTQTLTFYRLPRGN